MLYTPRFKESPAYCTRKVPQVGQGRITPHCTVLKLTPLKSISISFDN